MTNGDKLREARDLLKAVGLAKGIRMDAQGCCCSVELLNVVHGNEDWESFPYTDDMEAFLHAATLFYPDRIVPNMLDSREYVLAQAITDFNNDVGTTQEDVERVLDEAAKMRDLAVAEAMATEAQLDERVVA